ncbi:MAG: hypothetical protein QGG64_17215, partial [Candidatus Latescibacteria bacterium]|nr:hypothetical protein [Candidatus Latescibacterota bacterium]
EDRSGITWLSLVPGTMGWVNVLAFIAVCLGAIYWRVRNGQFTDTHVILLAWVAVLMGYLMWEVRVFYPRHLLQVLPVVLLFVGIGYQKFILWVVERIRVPKKVVVVVVILLAWFFPMQDSIAMFAGKWGRTEKSVEIEAGQWLADQFGEETTVLYDSYAYIPSKFENAFAVLPAHTFLVVNHFEPDVIVLRKARFNRFQDLSEADRARVNKDTFYDIHYFYLFIQEDLIHDYELLKRFEGITIYRRRGKHNHTMSFDACKQLLSVNQIINIGRAREVMGDIHFAQKNWTLSARDYELGASIVPDYITLSYKLGRALIAAKDLNGGQSAFQKALTQIGEIAEEEWANIHLDIAQSYFAGGFYAQALESAEKALVQNEALLGAHFDLGACLVAMGKIDEAESIYIKAIARFGADSSGAAKLKVLRDRGVSKVDAERMLKMYFGAEEL